MMKRIITSALFCSLIWFFCGCPGEELPLPVTEILKAPPERSAESRATFEFECNIEDCDFFCRLNDRSKESCESPMQYSHLQDGEHSFEVWAVTSDGREEKEPARHSWLIDTRAPVTTISTDITNPTRLTNAHFSLSCDKEECFFECRLNDSDFEECGEDVYFENLDDGNHIFIARATDYTGNVESDPPSFRWTINTQSPLASIVMGPEALTSSTTAYFVLDCNRIDCELQCSLNEEPFSRCQGTTVRYDDLDDGEHVFLLQGVDSLGNIQEPPVTHVWTIDTVPPITTVSDFEIEGLGVLINFNCDKEPCTFMCAKGGGSGSPCEAPLDIFGLDIGEHIIEISATDSIGNEEAEPEILRFNIDEDDEGVLWRTFSSGGHHVCAIAADHGLWCWGRNDRGQLGDGGTVSRSIHEQMGDVFWRTVGAGYAHTCAVDNENRLWCWGRNDTAQVGESGGDDVTSPVMVDETQNWKAVSAGLGHTCGLTVEGSIFCFGRNDVRQLGTDDVSPPRHLPHELNGYGFTDLAAGYHHTCAIAGDGSVWCWGDNHSGQLSGGNEPGLRQVIGIQNAVSITAGAEHSCAVDSGGRIYCWGGNRYGQIGTGEVSMREDPTEISDGTNFIRVFSGSEFTCAIDQDSELYCWGRGYHGQLGTPPPDGLNSPNPVDEGSRLRYFSGGEAHSCSLDRSGAIWCWGSNGYGQLGTGVSLDRYMPAKVLSDAVWEKFSTGGYHTCAIDDNGSVHCWGRGNFGQLGIGTMSHRSIPVESALEDAVTVSAGEQFSCAIQDEGDLWCWGTNISGQMALPGSEPSLNPVSISIGQPFEQHSSGSNHVCGIAEDGSLWCWGDNAEGQLGDGTDGNYRHQPGQVGDSLDWTEISSGRNYTCGRRENSVWCWGENELGQLGIGTWEENYTELMEVEGDDWVQITAGEMHACGIRNDQSLWCWGFNEDGQLGDGTRTWSNVPAPIAPELSWTQVSGGAMHTCGIQTDGSLWCWGLNNHGQIGEGFGSRHLEPLQVTGEGWLDVQAGKNHTCALKEDRSLWCWGAFGYGQLGDGGAFHYKPQQLSPRG